MRQRTSFFIALLLISMLLLSGCLNLYPAYGGTEVRASPKYELTKTDLFAKKDWKGTDVSVFGVQLGDTKEDAIKKLGAPDLSRDFGNATNFEYNKGLAMPHTGLLFHFVNNKLTRITIKEPFNRFLANATHIGRVYKEEMYRTYGAPSKLNLLSHFTTYTYEQQGLEIFLSGKKLDGFSFVLPEAIREFESIAAALKNRTSGVDMAQIRTNVFHENDSVNAS